MKNLHLRFVRLFLGALVLSLFIGAVPVFAADAPNVSVSGQGVVSGAPNIAYVTVGISIEKPKASDAQTENAKVSAAVLKAIKDVGVKEDSIKTSNYSIYPNYVYKSTSYTLTGYTASNAVKVTLRDLDLVSKVIDAAASSGATSINGVSFGIEDTTKAYSEALKLAYANAYTKALALAAASGFSKVKPIQVTEGYSNYAPVYKGASDASANAGGGEPTVILADDVGVSANITVVFELVP